MNARANHLGIFCPARARVIFRLDTRLAQFGYKTELSRSAISKIFLPV